MRSYSDPTANAALGAIEREFKAKRKIVKRLQALRREGRLTNEAVTQASKQFTGIYRHLIDEVYQD